MKMFFLFFAASLISSIGAPVCAQTDSDRMVQRGLDAQKLGKDTEAFQWFQVAADEGNADGQYHLAYCYFTGQGTTLNDKLAKFWFLKAADQNDGKSEKYLGNIYENGWDVPADPGAAKNWYQRALQHGCKSAQSDLSRLEQLSSPTPSQGPEPAPPSIGTSTGNNDDAAEWAKKGAAAVKKQDWPGAFKWYKMAAEAGNIEGELGFANCYLQQLGVQQDYQESLKWYQKAADAGDPDGQQEVGMFYNQGLGISKDPAEAVKWYQKSADQGFAKGELELGVAYENGDGVPQDLEKAKEWIQKAADQGNSSAKFILKRIAKKQAAAPSASPNS